MEETGTTEPIRRKFIVASTVGAALWVGLLYRALRVENSEDPRKSSAGTRRASTRQRPGRPMRARLGYF